MKKRSLLLIVVAAALGGYVLIQRNRPKTNLESTAVAAVDERAQSVLKQANDACKALTGGSFQAEYRGEGVLAATTSTLRGTVQFDSAKEWQRMAVTLKETNGTERSFDLASDAERVVNVDHARKTYNFGKYPFARPLLGPGLTLAMPKFGDDVPFAAEMGRNPKHERVADEGGVPCDVISITRGGELTRWFFGQSDHLPRRVEYVYNLYVNKDSPDKTVLTLTDLKSDTAPAQANFQISTPEGYAENEIGEPEPLLAVGARAPDWELKTPSGQAVRLSQLRGNVVVLDFWATWCGPCKMAMPKIQELHAEFEGRPVKVFGVNCQENKNGDPEGYMKSKNYTYGLLLEGDRVAAAYYVSGIPTFYVIDKEGMIVHAESGAGHEDRIKEAVRIAVEKGST